MNDANPGERFWERVRAWVPEMGSARLRRCMAYGTALWGRALAQKRSFMAPYHSARGARGMGASHMHRPTSGRFRGAPIAWLLAPGDAGGP